MNSWTDVKVKEELLKCIDTLMLDRMPTAQELKDIGRNDLHCKISKTKKYSGWANELGLKLKESETAKGNRYEEHVRQLIERSSSHLKVKKMTTKHPYDLLVNDCVKIDVKAGKAHNHLGTRAHTFRLSKKYATCDIYVCVALDEEETIEKYLIIPSSHVQILTLNLGKNSKYNRYINNWGFINRFVNQYERALEMA